MKTEESRFEPSAVFEGMTSIRAVINSNKAGISDRQINKVMIDRERAEAKKDDISFLRVVSRELSFEIEFTDRAEIDSLSVGNSHGGIVALCSDRTIPALTSDRIATDGFYVMIEGIEDPYNFGYALRSIFAAGADGVILTPRNWMSAAGVVCRSSAGASELLPLFVSEPLQAVRTFKEGGYKAVAAGIRDSVSAFDTDLKRPVFLIVGGEKRGISRAVLDECDAVVRLEYGREFRASLSAASAASILAYEVLRQNIMK